MSHPRPALFAALVCASALASSPASDAQSDITHHAGIRRWSVNAVGAWLYAPNGAGLFAAGGRYSYHLHEYFDAEGSLSTFYVQTTAQGDSRLGFMLEGGAAVSGSLGSPNARIGAYATLGAASNLDRWAVVGGAGVELRFGGALSPTSYYGVDARLRTGFRAFQSLAETFPVDFAFGPELVLGLGGGGARPYSESIVVEGRDDRVIAAARFAQIVIRDFDEVTAAAVQRRFPVCRVIVHSAQQPLRVDEAPSPEVEGVLPIEAHAHDCDLSAGAPLTPTINTPTCTLYLATGARDQGRTLSLSVGAPTRTGVEVDGFATALIACASGEANARCGADGAGAACVSGQRAPTTQSPQGVAARVDLQRPWTATEGRLLPLPTAETTGPTLEANSRRVYLGFLPAGEGPWRWTLQAPNNQPVEVRIFAPAASALEATVATAASPLPTEGWQTLQWSERPQGPRRATGGHTLFLRRRAPPAARAGALPPEFWPVAIEVAPATAPETPGPS